MIFWRMNANNSNTAQFRVNSLSDRLGEKRLNSSTNILIEDKNNIEQVKKFAFAVCREFLGGAWLDVDFVDFSIKRIA